MTRPRLFLLGDTLKIGGTEGQFAEIATGLDRVRWEVEVSCLRAEGPLRQRLETAGVGVSSCGPGSLKSPRAGLAVWRLGRHLRARKVRLLHCFDFYSNALGVIAARIAGVPVVASQRDLGNLRSPFQRRVQRFMLQRADHVLVNSQAVGRRLAAERTLPADRITLIRNGVDVSKFHPASTPRERVGTLTVGTMANLRPEKGVVDIVKAAGIVCDRYDHVRFALFGDGPLRADLEGLIRARGLAGRVELRGATEHPAAALRDLDVFVLASHSEASSNGLLEAMATRLAVVATDVGGNPELVDDERTGLLVPPADPAGLAKAIIRLVEAPGLADKVAEGGLERIRSRFTVARMLEALDDFYARVLAASRSRCA